MTITEFNCMVYVYSCIRCTPFPHFTDVILSVRSWYGDCATDWLFWGLNSDSGKQFFLFSTTSRLAVGTTQPLVQWVPGFFPVGVKLLECDVNHSPPSSAEVKNVWTHTSTPPTCLHVVDRENFYFYFNLLSIL
jgi:hypothetical protein